MCNFMGSQVEGRNERAAVRRQGAFYLDFSTIPNVAVLPFRESFPFDIPTKCFLKPLSGRLVYNENYVNNGASNENG